MGNIRTLILSGGGGRGAFHAGVYQYLCQGSKPGVDDEHQAGWAPDIVVGTSIGAVNGAAIVQGMGGDELVRFWQSLREGDIEGLPPGMTWLSRWAVNLVMKGLIGSSLRPIAAQEATSPRPDRSWEMLPKGGRLVDWLVGRWSNLLDTGPLRRTIISKLGFDAEKIRNSRLMLLINTTNVATGRRVTFSNRPMASGQQRAERSDVIPGITVQRILASCSIPMIYPWTYDPETRGLYWDGAVVNNTPIGVALDAAQEFSETDEIEMVVVMMTPWRETGSESSDNGEQIPHNFGEAITWALDWALLASFRERLDLIEAYNRLGKLGRQIGDPELSRYRQIKVTIVAPENFIPAARIIDYDAWNNHLIVEGYRSAEQAFRKGFPAK
jgi:NTE family protein